MAMNGTNMANAVVDALATAGKLAGLSTQDKDTMKADMKVTYDAVIAYIVANMEIKGVTVEDPAGTVETYVAGEGSNGGTMNGQIPIVGNVAKAVATLSQNNDGIGRVS